MINMCEFYYNEDGTKIAILVSPGFGAGWSTWNDRNLAYDRRVIKWWLTYKDHDAYMKELDKFKDNPVKEATEQLFRSWGYDHVYFGGVNDISHLTWVDCERPFRITEYDGAESVEFLDTHDYIIAPARGASCYGTLE